MRRRALLAASGASGGGGGFGEEITFYLNAEPFGPFHELKALDGMTWGDWVDSEYNTVGIWEASTENFTFIYYPPVGFTVRGPEGPYVRGNNIIFAEAIYNID